MPVPLPSQQPPPDPGPAPGQPPKFLDRLRDALRLRHYSLRRHSFATHLIEDGYDIRTVQEPTP